MARIDISRDLESIAEAKRRKEYEVLERRRLLFEQARATVTKCIALTEEEVMKLDTAAWLEVHDWRFMGKDSRGPAWWANLEILHTREAFTCTMQDAVRITAAVHVMQRAGGTPEEMRKLGFIIPDVSTGY